MNSIPRLYAIVDVDLCARAGRMPMDVARALLAGGARWLQLRAKGWESGPMLELAAAIQSEVERTGGALIVNDRADVAVLARADGVHVGQDDLAPADARRLVGASAIVGISTHTPAQMEAAVQEEVSYLAIGPVFGTGTKVTGYEAVGLEAVRAAVAAAQPRGLPVVAIGGITLDRARSVIDSGAASVAVISDLLVGDPESRARAFMQALE